MKHLITKFAIGITGLILVFATSGCCTDEPVIIVPEPTPAVPTFSGTISTNGQAVLKGATVTVSLNGTVCGSATTDDKGAYSIQVKEEGIYAIKAEMKGYTSKEDVVATVSNAVSVWNAILPKPVRTSAQVMKDAETVVSAPIPSLLAESEKTDTIKMKFFTSSVSEDDSLIIEINYDASISELEQSKASLVMTLLNVRYYLLSGNPLKDSIDIGVEVSVKPDQIKLAGTPVPFKYDGKEVKIRTDKQGTLLLNYNVTLTEDVADTVGVVFEQSVWDNFYGSSEMRVLNPKYTLKTGGKVAGTFSLLNTAAANYLGLPAQSSQINEYPLDIILPVGGKLVLNGKQALLKYVFKVASVSNAAAMSTAYVYESAYITAQTYNRQHTGGGSN